MAFSRNLAKTLLLLACVGTPILAQASPLTYQPIDPSFGGNPQNGSNLLSIANAQNGYKPPATAVASANQTQAAQFLQQLQSRFLSALAANVTDAIFGPKPQEHGKIVFGTQTITFNRGLDAVAIDILDTSTGLTTSISVPILVPGP